MSRGPREQELTDELQTAPASGEHALRDERHATSGLPTATALPAPAPGADFEVGDTIGVGGMGEIVAATQAALMRPVALKFLRPTGGEPSVLVREAIVTGRLEHPNIVPVHALAVTSEGTPFFAMKLVEGTPWSDALRAGQPLVDALEVLLRVCDAVAFAHARHVLHRDIKPDNVLVGAFGEVYLVDWGLAVSLVPDGVLPLAELAGPGGTPAYLAPEMASGDSAALAPQTDVYLLGATLFELLAGHPPHQSGSASEALARAQAGVVPDLPGDAPRELAAICRKALARDPADRFPSAGAFKQAVTTYLRHREASALYEQARHRLTQLEQLVSQRRAGVEGSTLGLSAHTAFSECRFGFAQVRRLWPEFEEAARSHERALELMAQHEAAHGNARAARIFLAQLEAPPPELLREVEHLEATEEARRTRLADLEREAGDREIDLALADKRTLSLVFGLVVLGVSVVVHWLAVHGSLQLTTGLGLGVYCALVAWAELASLVLNRSVQNRAQRQIANGLRLSAWVSLAFWAGAWVAELPAATALSGYLLLVASNWLLAAALFHRRAVLVGGPMAIAAFASLLAPAWVVLIAGAGGFLGFSLLAWDLSRTAPPKGRGT